jgi:hypothetical protein
MRVVEVMNGVVTHFPPYWDSLAEIPPGTNPIYFEAPDHVQEGWLFDYETHTFSEPPPEPELPQITAEDNIHASMYIAVVFDILIAQGGFPDIYQTDRKVSVAEGDITSQMGIQENKLSFTQRFESYNESSPRYDFWKSSYFRNHTNSFTLERLVAGGVLTQEEVTRIIADRIEKFGI